MEFITLNNEVKMPLLGFGTWELSSWEVLQYAAQAIELGYRSIDTAQNYDTEQQIGQAVAKSGIPREAFFITTKTMTKGYQRTLRSIDRSLRNLGMDYVDLLLIHWPTGEDQETYRALEEAYRAGKARAIGVANFNRQQLLGLSAKCQIPPMVNQIETHIFWQQAELNTCLQAQGCAHEAWAPFGEGMGGIFRDPQLTEIGGKYHKTAAQVALRFLVQQGIVAIPKSRVKRHIAENIDIFDFRLTGHEMAVIQSMDRKQSCCGWPASMQER